MLALRIVTALLAILLLIGAGWYIESLRSQKAQQAANIKALQASGALLAQQENALAADKATISNENTSLRTDIENAKQTTACANGGAGAVFLDGVRKQQHQQSANPASGHHTAPTH